LPLERKPLFRPDVLRPRLQAFELPERIDHHRHLLAKWAELLKGPDADRLKEQELLGDFLTDIFVTLLGYTRPADSPQRYTISREQHVEAFGKFADGVLGEFTTADRRFVVAIEGKGPTDPLDRPFKSRAISAVDQGYRYAINLPCDWIIVTSLRNTRLYCKGTDQLTYELFPIADLVTNDHLLKKFVFLLGAERVVPATGRCHLDVLREASDKAGRELTRDFYQRYANMREDVFEQLCAHNQQHSRHDLLAATQHLLDRVLFCAFCEDRGLLPEDTLTRAFSHRDPYNPRPVWENFRGLFRAINVGNPDLRIPPYNGGLFAEDPIADAVSVPDAVCGHFKELGEYDYRAASDALDDPDRKPRGALVDVDILGHIFEQSISDLEQIRNELDGLVPAQGKEKHKTRRKKEGAFYTPAFITRYIVEQTLGQVLADRFEQLRSGQQSAAKSATAKALADPRVYDRDALKKGERDALIEFWEAWQAELATIRVLDPACGSGAFLIEAFDHMYAEYQRANDRLTELRKQQPSLFYPDARILQHNLYGVDLNEEAIQICRLSLWIKTAHPSRPLTSLDHTIRVGNSVVDDPAVHPRAFDWQTAFPEVTAAGGFDVVIGNPPYIRQEWLKAYKPHWQAAFRSFHGKADIYVYFYERGIQLLRPDGRLSFVVTNKWLKATYGEPLRQFFAENSWIESVVDFGHAKQIFVDADAFPSIIVVRKPSSSLAPDETRICSIPREQLRIDNLSEQIQSEGFSVPRVNFSRDAWTFEPQAGTDLLEKIREAGIPLADFCGVAPVYGIKTGFNDAFLIDSATRDQLIRRDPSSATIIQPYLRGQDIKRWTPEWDGLWMIAAYRGIEIEQFPAVLEHLSRYRAQLEPRPKDWKPQSGEEWLGRASGAYAWYELQTSIENRPLFERPKIVYQEIQFHPWYARDDRGLLTNNKCFILPIDDLYVLAVLNSPLMWWHNFRHLPHMKDEALSPVGFLMRDLPIAQPRDPLRAQVEAAVARLIEITRGCRQVARTVVDWLRVEHNLDKPGTLLSDPLRLDDESFVAEVKKRRGRKNSLSVAALKSLRDEYARTITPARALLAEADRLERRLSDCVNEAYGLTPDEIDLMWATAPPRMPIGAPRLTS